MIKNKLKETLEKKAEKEIYKPLLKVDADLAKILMNKLNIIIIKNKITSKKKKKKKKRKSLNKKRFREINSFLNLTKKYQTKSRSELGSFISLSKKKIILKKSFLKKKLNGNRYRKKMDLSNSKIVQTKSFNNSEIIFLNKSRSLKKKVIKDKNKRKRKIKINSNKNEINFNQEKKTENFEKKNSGFFYKEKSKIIYYKKNDDFNKEYINMKNLEFSNIKLEDETLNKKNSTSKKENMISSNNLEIIPKFLNKINSLNSLTKNLNQKSPIIIKKKIKSKNKNKNLNNISLRNRSIYFNTVDKYSISKKFFQKFKVNKNFSDSLKKFKPKSLFRNKTSLAHNLKYKFLSKKF